MRRMTIGLMIALGLLIPGIRAVSAVQERPTPTVDYQVRPGDTLWGIVGAIDSEGDRRALVHELIELNELQSPALTPGQTLQIPRR